MARTESAVQDELDLSGVARTLRRRRWLIAVPLAAGVIAGLVFGFLIVPPPANEASTLIQPARGTNDLYANADAIAFLLQDAGFQRTAFRDAGLASGPRAMAISARPLHVTNPNQAGADIVALTVRSSDVPGPRLALYTQALVDALIRRSGSVVDERRRAILDGMEKMSASAIRLGEALARSVPPESAPASRLMAVTTLSSAMQGFYSAWYQSEKDLVLQTAEIQPPRIIEGVFVANLPRQPRTRTAVAAVLLGAVVGISLAFLAEAAVASTQRQSLAGGSSRLPADAMRSGAE